MHSKVLENPSIHISVVNNEGIPVGNNKCRHFTVFLYIHESFLIVLFNDPIY